MSVFSRPKPATPPAATETVVDIAAGPSPVQQSGDPLLDAFTGPQAQSRSAALHRALNAALDDWWRTGALPAAPLLRDSLLLLEAGHPLDEAQRSLLLRAALTARRGMLTALRHQTDPERTAVILAEALLEGETPLQPAELASLARRDEHGEAWQPALKLVLLQDAAHPDPVRRTRVAQALAALADPAPIPFMPVPAVVDATPAPGRPWLRFVLLLLMVGVVAGVFWWQQRAVRDMALVPAGLYSLRADPGAAAPRTIDLAAFAIDNTEVTNAAYLRCVEQNICAWPAATASATRPHYFLSPAFAHHPVVQVDWLNAERFCTFAGKRLPTAAEWEVAASYAPATRRQYRYPWGDQFLVQAANSGALGLGDTLAVGAYRPVGDSPFGLSEMAGNVAEWTATPAQGNAADAAQYLVKGGSFRDEAAQLEAQASLALPAQSVAAWLGFRCAASIAQP